MPRTPILRFFVVMIFALVAGCAGMPEGEASAKRQTGFDCPSWKMIVVEDGRIYCVDRDVLERDEDW